MKKISFIFLFISANLFAEEYRGSYLDFSFQRASASLEHKEESTDPAFQSINTASNFAQNIFSLTYGREFFSESFFSFSLFGSLKVGVAQDSGEKAGVNDSFDFEDNYSSYGGGVGAAINMNTTLFDERVQFYVSAESAQKLNTYFLRYDDETNDDRSFEIEYKEEETSLIGSLGVRVINLKNRFSSHFAVHVLSRSTNKIDIKASQGKTTFDLTSTGELTKDNAAFSIGFGYFF